MMQAECSILREVLVIGVDDHRLEHFIILDYAVGRIRVADDAGGIAGAARIVYAEEVAPLKMQRLFKADAVYADGSLRQTDAVLEDVFVFGDHPPYSDIGDAVRIAAEVDYLVQKRIARRLVVEH